MSSEGSETFMGSEAGAGGQGVKEGVSSMGEGEVSSFSSGSRS